MALEAVVYPPQDPFTYSYKDNYHGLQTSEDEKVLLGIINNNIEQNLHTNICGFSNSTTLLQQNVKDQLWDYSHSSSPEACSNVEARVITTTLRKRRRTKNTKNKEEIENQRITHITVERNRRKQMNEYLAVLRSLMPSSYVQRGDQASIIGGAINFVKELEQVLQTVGGKKKTNQAPFTEFFTFPQYTTRASQSNTSKNVEHNKKQWAVADIEVTMVDSHADMKILSKKRTGQLMKIVVGLQNLRLTILHLNVTTLDNMVLYSISVKVEEGSQLNTVDEIAAAVNQLLRTIQDEEVAFN